MNAAGETANTEWHVDQESGQIYEGGVMILQALRWDRGSAVTPDFKPEAIGRERAARAVQAVNAYDDLLTRLEEVTSALMAFDMGNQPSDIVGRIERANAAIAKAKQPVTA